MPTMSIGLQKTEMVRSPALRESARGEDCAMNSPMCNHNPETTVWCHSNHQEHGKGAGLKAHDVFGFYGCGGCHAWYDIESRRKGSVHYVGADERQRWFRKAHDRSLLRAIEKGVIRL